MNAATRRFWKHIKLEAHVPDPGFPKMGSPCHIWTAATSKNGYGLFSVNGELEYTHIYAWELKRGALGPKDRLDHLCRRRACANPDHLESVTDKENTLRGEGPTAKNARKTHCPLGHPYDEANTIVTKDERRRCRACLALQAAERREMRRMRTSSTDTEFSNDHDQQPNGDHA